MQLIPPAGLEAELAMFYAWPSSIAKMYEHASSDKNGLCFRNLFCYLLVMGG